MKNRTLLIVPPRGRIRALRIRIFTAVLFLLIICIGFAGYFIPFNSFTLDIVEKNQKRNLSEQNKKLMQRIFSTIQLLNNLKDEIAALQQQKTNFAEISGTPHSKGHKEHKNLFNIMHPAAMLRLTTERAAQFQLLKDSIVKNGNAFSLIPVCRPIVGESIISRQFGRSKDPFTGKEKWHFGLDLAAEPGSQVVATANGVVTKTETDPLWGKKITIDHSNGFRTVYAHLGSLTVAQGKEVKRGTVIGAIGETGLSSGPHVHYEIWRNGKALNPEMYLFPSIDSLLE